MTVIKSIAALSVKAPELAFESRANRLKLVWTAVRIYLRLRSLDPASRATLEREGMTARLRAIRSSWENLRAAESDDAKRSAFAKLLRDLRDLLDAITVFVDRGFGPSPATV